MIYRAVRPLLFRLDAERAHHLSLRAIALAGAIPLVRDAMRRLFDVRDARLQTNICGLEFTNPIGLAAGYDKNGTAIAGLAGLGFGHLEMGTLTLHPQFGNALPRMHRVRECEGVINSLGFPNKGVDAFLAAAEPYFRDGQRGITGSRPILGINLGKGKDTPLEQAAQDYCELVRKVHSRADYIVINISSPNTPELRMLQTRAYISELLAAVISTRNEAPGDHRSPVFVKISPDLTDAELDDILVAVDATRIDGIIATNTTLERRGIPVGYAGLKGGLSGAPLRARSTELIRKVYTRTNGVLPIIGVGGIDSPQAALEKIRAGASLIQIYSGMVYRGPGLAHQINLGILKECQRLGVRGYTELVGTVKI